MWVVQLLGTWVLMAPGLLWLAVEPSSAEITVPGCAIIPPSHQHKTLSPTDIQEVNVTGRTRGLPSILLPKAGYIYGSTRELHKTRGTKYTVYHLLFILIIELRQRGVDSYHNEGHLLMPCYANLVAANFPHRHLLFARTYFIISRVPKGG